MNVTFNRIDAVNATLTVALSKDDYQQPVDKAINKLRQTIALPGFRKGMAPKSRIQALYGKSVLADEVNKLVVEKIYEYIKENQLQVLGDPLPSQTEQAPIDFNTQQDYEFTFDVALAPEIDIKLTKRDKLPYYTIAVTDEMIDRQIASYKANFGEYDTSVEGVEEKDMVKGLLTENDGKIVIEEAVLMPAYIKDETERQKFIGAHTSDAIIFNPYKAYQGHEAELKSLLKINKDEVAAHQGDFTLNITEITRFREAEIGQTLFDKVFGTGVVTDEIAFREKVKASLTAQLTPESDYKFLLDAKTLLENKGKDLQFPDELLKRWLLFSNDKRTPESLEKDYPKIIEDLTFQLIKDKICKDNNLQVTKEEIEQQARRTARAQFAQYGLNASEEMIERYAPQLLEKQENVENLTARVLEEKLIAFLKTKITLTPKEVSAEEFNKLFA